MACDLLDRRSGSRQQLGGVAMAKLAFSGEQVSVHGRGNQWVSESEWRLGAQDFRARQRCQRGRGLLLPEPRKRRDNSQLGAITQHRHRLRDHPRLGGQPPQPQQHRARHRPRPEVLDQAQVRRVRPHRLHRQRLQQLAQQQRVSSRCPLARCYERRLGRHSQSRLHQLGSGRLTEVPRTHRHTLAHHRADQRRVVVL